MNKSGIQGGFAAFFAKRSMVFFLLLISQAAAAAGGGPISVSVDVSVAADDNITRAQAAGDVEEDMITRMRVDARYALDFSLNRSLIFTGHVQDESYQDFDGVSNTQAGLGIEYRFRTRPGFGAPVYAFYINNTQADYETDNRDGDTLEYGLRLSRQFSDRIALAVGTGQSERTADGVVFDLEQAKHYAHLDYRVPNRFQLYLTYSYINGDAYSISSIAPADYGGGNSFYDAVEWDPAFSMERPHWAYRMDAQTNVLRLGFNFSINGNNAIDISLDKVDSETTDSVIYEDDTSGGSGYGYSGGGGTTLTYDTTILMANFFHRF
jgi:hypothetical protein